jgi:hypothetical protein
MLISIIITTFEFFEKDSNDEIEKLDSFIFVLTKKVKFRDYPTLHIDGLQKEEVNFFFLNANNFL